MKPAFADLQRRYPRTASRAELYDEIGWGDLVENSAYFDTCATRMSVALLKAGVALPGARMRANTGSLRGKRIEPGQGKLSQILKRTWGIPERYRGEAAAKTGIGKRSGVVSFFRINGGGGGGHIDIVAPGRNGFLECARACYFSAMEVWFWPLK